MNEYPKSDFYTLKKYQLQGNAVITESMEDYIEMIYRISEDTGYTRINDLSRMINVSPSSASKMVHKLNTLGYVVFPKYGVIQLTDIGKNTGRYLIWRHQTLESFLCLLNGTSHETKQVEQIEHYINESTLKNIEKATRLLRRTQWKPDQL